MSVVASTACEEDGLEHNRGVMKLRFGQLVHISFLAVSCLCLVSALAASAAAPSKSAQGTKTKIEGVIVWFDGSLLKVEETKSGSMREVKISENTRIKGDHKMGAKALVPGLTVKVAGVVNTIGEIDARTIRLYPDAFAFAVGPGW